jgi:hypothetical protein
MIDPADNCSEDGRECAPWLVPLAQGMGAIVALGAGLNMLANPNRGSFIDPATGDLVWWQGRIGARGGDEGRIHPSRISRRRIVRQDDSDDEVHLYDLEGNRLFWFDREVIPCPINAGPGGWRRAGRISRWTGSIRRRTIADGPARRPDGRRTGNHSGVLKIDGRGLAALVGFQLVRNALFLVQRRHAGALDGADVNEAVARAIFIGNETIAFVVVEEFYGADGHGCFLSRKQGINRQKHRRSW